MKFIRQLCIIITISFIAEIMEYFIPLPVAASIYGLLLMLGALLLGIIKVHQVEQAAAFLVEILPILFVPPTVRIMSSAEQLKALLIPITVISIVTTIIIMGVTGGVAQGLMGIEDKGRGKNKKGSQK